MEMLGIEGSKDENEVPGEKQSRHYTDKEGHSGVSGDRRSGRGRA